MSKKKVNIACENDFIEMSLKDAYKVFPALKQIFLPDVFADDEYIVRFTKDGKIEVGYSSDAWTIQ